MQSTADGLTRRRFFGVAAGATLVAGGLHRAPSWPTGSHAESPAGGWLVEPRRLRSHGGFLPVTLVAQERKVLVAGQQRTAIIYNGSFPGPTLVAHPGDRIMVRLVNRLADSTNLHTHGFHVSPEGNSDNVLLDIPAGETFEFQFDIPRNHAPGLNWYHPHPHGHGTRQLFGGMAGAVIFRSAAERRGAVAPMLERVLVLQAPEWDMNGELKTWSPALLATQQRLVNGQLNPRIAIRAGETQRWRILNASVSDFFDLHLDGHVLTQIAADGNPFDRELERDVVRIPAGGRAEVLVRGGAPGTYALHALPSDHGAGFVSPDIVLATVESFRGRRPRRIRSDQLLEPFCDLRKLPVDNRRQLTMTMTGGFMIDGKKFDHDRVDQVVELGALEEWTITNDSVLVHPFHIHVNPFQLTHIDGMPVDERSYRDTVTVGARGGSITFRTVFADFTGKSVFHCHIVPHSDLGMMGVFEVVPRGGARRAPVGRSKLVCRL
jgi:FtsP/CotA-like multicopper oxidase with cupredoxin domain